MEIKEGIRYELINFLIKKYNFTDYLEIGYQSGVNYNEIDIKNKTAVDPSPRIQTSNISVENNINVDKDINLYLTTSNNFFNNFEYKYDIIFIDGLHTYEQVKEDFENSLKSLNENGIIVLHDMNPQDVEYNGGVITGEERSRSFADGGQWNGDCYKLSIDIFNGEYLYEYVTLDMDQGCMVVSPFKLRDKIVDNNIKKDYQSLSSNRTEILNLKSISEFIEIMK